MSECQSEHCVLRLISAWSETEVRCIAKQGAGGQTSDHSFNLSWLRSDCKTELSTAELLRAAWLHAEKLKWALRLFCRSNQKMTIVYPSDCLSIEVTQSALMKKIQYIQQCWAPCLVPYCRCHVLTTSHSTQQTTGWMQTLWLSPGSI